jgi:TolB protein
MRVRQWALCLVGALVGNPSWSAPDRPLAYLAVEKGYWQVWLARLDGSDARVLTTSPYDKMKVGWHPDGERVLINGTAGELALVTTARGSEAPFELPFGHGSDVRVSPDGHWLSFSAVNVGSADTNDIWVSRMDGSEARKVASLPALQHEPVWSPDGRTIYFLSGRGRQSHDIYRVSIDGAGLEQITAGQLYHFDLDVAPDGSLLYSGNRSGNYDIYVRDAAGQAHAIVATDAFEAQPVWLPAGEGIVFTRAIEGVPNLWTAQTDGSKARAITRYKQGARAAAIWRASGASPCFVQ